MMRLGSRSVHPTQRCVSEIHVAAQLDLSVAAPDYAKLTSHRFISSACHSAMKSKIFPLHYSAVHLSN